MQIELKGFSTARHQTGCGFLLNSVEKLGGLDTLSTGDPTFSNRRTQFSKLFPQLMMKKRD